jgi:hypothetical protein
LVRRRVAFSALFVLVALAAGCAVGVQYGMKLIVGQHGVVFSGAGQVSRGEVGSRKTTDSKTK